MAVGKGETVTAILVAYFGDEWIPSCLDSLLSSSERRIHLVLIDNAGNSAIDRLDLDTFNAEVISTPQPMGFAEANNFALLNASRLEGSVLFLNQDTLSTVGWIDECRRAFVEDPSLGAVSPVIRTYDDDGWDPSFLACLDERQRQMLEDPSAHSRIYVKNAPAPALLIRTEVLRRTGPFDPIFGSYYEDYDLCRRIRSLGYRIAFVTNASIRHYSGSTTTSRDREMKRMRQVIRNRFIYQLRESKGNRARRLLRQFAGDLPRRLARGLLGTPSSQPPAVTLKAHVDLLRIADRLFSRDRDENAWRTYLENIGWNERFADTPPSEAAVSSTS